MFEQAKEHYAEILADIKEAGLIKDERVINSPQGSTIEVAGRTVLNFCANNYLGLANDPRVVAAAHSDLDERGYGLSSVRFICGTQDRHKILERKISEFLGTEDSILYSSCFDANTGLFETLLGHEDAVLSDALNHASIIDGVRLCKAQRYVFEHDNMADLEEKLRRARDVRLRLIATDGVFSMDGDVAHVDAICDLADKYEAMVMVDDSHATGVVGKTGRGSPEYRGCLGRVDIITSTLGKALGGASGGFTSARREIIDLLRNRSRPYLFSNSLAPMIVSASIAVLDLISGDTQLRDTLAANTLHFREGMIKAGFKIRHGPSADHPIVPIMLGEARLAVDFAARLLDEGIYVIGFSYPVVPKGEARIRVQLSAAHTTGQVQQAVEGFVRVKRQLGV